MIMRDDETIKSWNIDLNVYHALVASDMCFNEHLKLTPRLLFFIICDTQFKQMRLVKFHYSGVIMSAMASRINGVSIKFA